MKIEELPKKIDELDNLQDDIVSTLITTKDDNLDA